MKAQFLDLSERLFRELHAGEILLCVLSAERSDFVRFNRAQVRQAGSVEQRHLALHLVHERRHAEATITIGGDSEDLALARAAVTRLRDTLRELADDPWLMIAETPCSTENIRRGTVPPPESAVEEIVRAAKGYDLVGLYAGGTLYRGFANSLGQRNWHEVDSFNFDWSLHLDGDKAVKAGYAGLEWSSPELEARMNAAGRELDLLAMPQRTLVPGEYRAYLAPRALEELAGMLAFGAFSARARATRQSPLLRMEQGAALSPQLTLVESTGDGMAPQFQSEGYLKPDRVSLITKGRLGEPLVSPRSAKEYRLAPNGAEAMESPQSLDMAAGTLASADVLTALDAGLYLNNLWYLNYSDRPAARITGMTRFAAFWVERGRIAAPVAAMRFDDTVYRMLGENLAGLTEAREFLPDTSTYGARSARSARLPGALLRALKLTL